MMYYGFATVLYRWFIKRRRVGTLNKVRSTNHTSCDAKAKRTSRVSEWIDCGRKVLADSVKRHSAENELKQLTMCGGIELKR